MPREPQSESAARRLGDSSICGVLRFDTGGDNTAVDGVYTYQGMHPITGNAYFYSEETGYYIHDNFNAQGGQYWMVDPTTYNSVVFYYASYTAWPDTATTWNCAGPTGTPIKLHIHRA